MFILITFVMSTDNSMKDRIQRFLQSENKSYAQFAEEIGVQASGISHILSGRNNPSLDFVVKMLSKYPALSSEWLLFGRGSMYKTIIQPTLFDEEVVIPSPPCEKLPGESEILNSEALSDTPEDNQPSLSERKEHQHGQKLLEKVLLFYSDKTFTEYKPS